LRTDHATLWTHARTAGQASRLSGRAREPLMTRNRLAPSSSPAWGGRRPPAPLGGARRPVRTPSFPPAALYFLVFALSMLGVLLFVYWTSSNFVERQVEATLDAEINGLTEQYAQRGLSGLVQLIAARSAGNRGDNMAYLVTGSDGAPLAGN